MVTRGKLNSRLKLLFWDLQLACMDLRLDLRDLILNTGDLQVLKLWCVRMLYLHVVKPLY